MRERLTDGPVLLFVRLVYGESGPSRLVMLDDATLTPCLLPCSRTSTIDKKIKETPRDRRPSLFT